MAGVACWEETLVMSKFVLVVVAVVLLGKDEPAARLREAKLGLAWGWKGVKARGWRLKEG